MKIKVIYRVSREPPPPDFRKPYFLNIIKVIISRRKGWAYSMRGAKYMYANIRFGAKL
jgi:hypothetical protein